MTDSAAKAVANTKLEMARKKADEQNRKVRKMELQAEIAAMPRILKETLAHCVEVADASTLRDKLDDFAAKYIELYETQVPPAEVSEQ